MSKDLALFVKEKCGEVGNDRTRMMDVVRAVQSEFCQVSSAAMDLIATGLKTHRVEVESVVSFYAFLNKKPKGTSVIRLCNGCIDKMHDSAMVAQAFCDELGIKPGETTPCGKITLEYTACMGMCDQTPAAMVNDMVVRRLSTDDARNIVKVLRAGEPVSKLVDKLGDGNNAHPLVKATVMNNIRKEGEVIFGTMEAGVGLKAALALNPAEVIRTVKTARLRGRGGAGFPAGMKWEFARAATGDRRFVLCNADEGEPGTFKDRVILTERPDFVFEGMTVAGYAIGASEGIVYLRGEYAYLRPFLEEVLNQRRTAGLLGNNAGGKAGFNFDIRIQMGAGAYICGEETALISSCEGLRGDPKNRPPFPAQKGYLQSPTIVNNVETFCCVTRIMEKGPGWFSEMGTSGTAGTKLLSVSGDTPSAGIYEVPFGTTIKELLTMVAAENTLAVQVGGPSGQMIGEADFGRQICYDDLATGGSIMVFNKTRDLLEVATGFMEFFNEESCGYCTPCRVGNVLLEQKLELIREGKAEPADLDYLVELGETIKATSRCGLGQTSPNPILTTLKNFRSLYEAKTKAADDGFQPSFDLDSVLGQSRAIAGRGSVHFED